MHIIEETLDVDLNVGPSYLIRQSSTEQRVVEGFNGIQPTFDLVAGSSEGIGERGVGLGKSVRRESSPDGL